MKEISDKLDQIYIEMDRLQQIRESYITEINHIDTRMTQLVGAIQALKEVLSQLEIKPNTIIGEKDEQKGTIGSSEGATETIGNQEY